MEFCDRVGKVKGVNKNVASYVPLPDNVVHPTSSVKPATSFVPKETSSFVAIASGSRFDVLHCE